MLCYTCIHQMKDNMGVELFNELYVDPYTFNPLKDTLDMTDSFDPKDPNLLDNLVFIDMNIGVFDDL